MANNFRCQGWHTQHNTTTSIIHNHLCFKPKLSSLAIAIMPFTSAPAPPPMITKATGGSDPNSGFFVATSATSFTTNSGRVSQEDFSLVAKLQRLPIHAPPGAHLTCAGSRPLTKNQLAVERKYTKEAKATAMEERKSAVTARKTDIALKRQERLITSVEAKATKATTKANELCLELATATKPKRVLHFQQLLPTPTKKSGI
jgi:hypothetical protein